MKKTLLWTGVVVLFAAMLGASVVFLLACSVPDEYQPLQLLPQERKEAAELSFVNEHAVPFRNAIIDVKPFTHELTQVDLNHYLASLDEIAFLKPGRRGEARKTGGVYEAMDKAGLADPFVTMHDGLLTIMVRTKQTNKVVSLDLSMQMADDGLQIALEEVRIGRMPVPRALITGALDVLRETLAKQKSDEEVSERDLDRLLAAVIGGIDGEPMPTTMKFGKKRIRKVTDVTIEEGLIRVRIIPVDEEGNPIAPTTEPAGEEGVTVED